MIIPPLDYNVDALPNSIREYLNSLGFIVTTGQNENEQFILQYPFKTQLRLKKGDEKYVCYPLDRHCHRLKFMLMEGLLCNEDGTILKKKGQLIKYLISYAKGFVKGYTEFHGSIDKEKIFKQKNKQKAHNIFQRIYRPTDPKDGNISRLSLWFSKSEVGATQEEEIEQFYNGNFKQQYLVKEEIFYNNGVEGGEFYKAWEIVLKEPTNFEKLFDQIGETIASNDVKKEQRSNTSEANRIINELTSYDFFKLELVNILNNTNSLIDLIATNDCPYQIAMLDFLGFIKYIEQNYCSNRTDLYNTLSAILTKTCGSFRTVKGNVNVLLPSSREDRDRYTAYKYKDTVQEDYKKLN